MKNVLLLVGLMLVMSSLGWAGACTADSLQTYLTGSNSTCSIDDKTFSTFGYSSTGSGGASAVPASGVNVIPCLGNTGASQCVLYMPAGEEGFIFTGSWSAPVSGESLDAAITYKITTTGSIVDALNLFGGFGGSGTGGATVDETASAFPGSLHLVFPPGTTSSDSITFAPVSSVIVTKDIAVTAGTSGSGSLSFVENGWSQIPEPRTVSLLAIGLLGLMGMARRRLKKS